MYAQCFDFTVFGYLFLQEKRQQAVFDEWKDLEKELNDIGQVRLCSLCGVQRAS